jgi:thiol-disulfide isomerase/thioredoxin
MHDATPCPDRKTVIRFTLYSRSYCHLCEDMLLALHRFSDRYLFEVEVIDIDLDADLVERYDELVPVLVGCKDGGNEVKLCHYFLDDTKVGAFLAAA